MAFLTGLENKDMETVNSLWTDYAVHDMPYVPKGWEHQLVGKEALVAQYASWPQVTGEASFTDSLIFYSMTDPQAIFVEFDGIVEVLATGETYRQTYGCLFHVEDGKITLYREYFDPCEYERAFLTQP